METIEDLLYAAIKELEYVQLCADNCNGLCASSDGKELIERGMAALGVKELYEATLAAQSGL